jgi:predicted ATPase
MKPTLDTGDYAAEYDEHLLKVWINYYSLPDLLNDKTFIVVGGKGAGKTALAKYLSHTELMDALKLNVSNMNLASLTTMMAELRDEYNVDSRAIVKAWEHLFVVQIMAHIWADRLRFERAGASHSDCEMVAKYLKSLLKRNIRATNRNVGYALRKILAILLEFLHKYELESRDPDEDLLVSYPERSKAASGAVAACLRILKATNIRIRLILDGFDQFIDQHMGENYDVALHAEMRDLFVSLLNGTCDLAKKSEFGQYVFPKILFPADKLPVHTRDFSKVDQHIKSIRWCDQDLFEFMSKRIAFALDKPYQEMDGYDATATWNFMFKGTIKQQRSFEYILSRTHARPRDFLVLCDCIISRVAGEQRAITSDMVQEGVRIGSSKFYTYFLNEYEAEHPYLPKVLELFRGSRAIMSSSDELRKLLREGVRIVHQFWGAHQWGIDLNENYLLDVFSNVGFMGRVMEGSSAREPCRQLRGKKYSTEFSYVVGSQIKLLPNYKLCIHPAFYAALDIVEDDEMIVGPISQYG